MSAMPEQDGGPDGATRMRAAHDERLHALIVAYVDAERLGQAPDRARWLAENPDVAAELATFLSAHDQLQQLGLPTPDVPRPARSCAPSAGEPEATLSGSAANGSTHAKLPPASAGGRFVGDYVLLERIAHGGMGVVYKARQVSLDRIVAVKMILAGELAGEADVQRFHTEATAAANLQHPHIVKVYEVGRHAGQHYFSMEYVEGPTLAKLVRDGPLPAKRAARYVQQIAEALDYAHQKGVIHRDLKPSNVLIDAGDRARVTDFGLAKRVEAEGSLTVSGQILGTPQYIAPEQVGPRREPAGPHTDVYGLGAVLYELLTGRPPFYGQTVVETLIQVRENDPVPPRWLNPQTPRELELVCLKCLEKDPLRRYPTAQAVADDLACFLRGESINVSSLNLWDRLARTLERSYHDVEFHTWSTMLTWLAVIVCAAHTAVFLILYFGTAHTRPWVAVVRGMEFAAMGVMLWAQRQHWFPPRSMPSRQLFSLWIAYLAGTATFAVIGRLRAAAATPFDELSVYPQLAVLASLGYIMMGSSYWGYCYLFGAIFLVLAVVMSAFPTWAPLMFAVAWIVCLLAIARRLRRLADKAP
jgi:serine/threonine protein kinase